MGCACPGLFPLLLLSKLVSKLDVLPGQFEVASPPPPPPVLPIHRRPGAKAGLGGWGEGVRATVVHHQGLRRGERDPPPSPSQAQALASFGWDLYASVPEPWEAWGEWPRSRASAHF